MNSDKQVVFHGAFLDFFLVKFSHWKLNAYLLFLMLGFILYVFKLTVGFEFYRDDC